MKKLLVVFALLRLCVAAGRTELGEINGAKFRIDVPERWNGSLVVYCHGYSDTPGTFESKPNPFIDIFVNQGYAFIQSGYAAVAGPFKKPFKTPRRCVAISSESTARPRKHTRPAIRWAAF
jgi:hypothetical protein